MDVSSVTAPFAPAAPAASVPVTAEDVVFCYRNLLRRDPESEEVVNAHVQAAPDFRELVNIFVQSEEYRARAVAPDAAAPQPQLQAQPRPSIGAAANEVEHEVPPDVLASCLARVKHAWTHLGEQRPHYSVITQEDYLPESIDTNLDRFRKSGLSEVEDAMAVLRRYVPEERIKDLTVNELGCGVGRVTIPMSRKVSFVNGFDISLPHLAIATQYAKDAGVANIHFQEVEAGTVPAFPSCDLFYSRIVLQHNPPPLIMALLRAMLRSVRGQGVVFFQVPTYIAKYRFSTKSWLASRQPLDMEMHSVPMAAVFGALQEQGFAVREVREDTSCGATIISDTFIAQKAA